MQLDQPPPDLPVPDPTPFDHLRPSLWRASQVAHIVFASLGTLMLLPGAFVLYLLVMAFVVMGVGSGRASLPPEAMLAMVTAVGSTCFGVLAWAALCLLFFKRNDARWQRVCWGFCATFGIVASPCLTGWIIWLVGENRFGSHRSSELWFLAMLLGMLGTAVACLLLGIRYARAANRALKHPPTEEDRIFLG